MPQILAKGMLQHVSQIIVRIKMSTITRLSTYIILIIRLLPYVRGINNLFLEGGATTTNAICDPQFENFIALEPFKGDMTKHSNFALSYKCTWTTMTTIQLSLDRFELPFIEQYPKIKANTDEFKLFYDSISKIIILSGQMWLDDSDYFSRYVFLPVHTKIILYHKSEELPPLELPVVLRFQSSRVVSYKMKDKVKILPPVCQKVTANNHKVLHDQTHLDWEGKWYCTNLYNEMLTQTALIKKKKKRNKIMQIVFTYPDDEITLNVEEKSITDEANTKCLYVKGTATIGSNIGRVMNPIQVQIHWDIVGGTQPPVILFVPVMLPGTANTQLDKTKFVEAIDEQGDTAFLWFIGGGIGIMVLLMGGLVCLRKIVKKKEDY
eukprot:GHVR01083999.1.p1 GENE.GHVR01083999.1~~GHVR01083999.1.p1  ORF type:complete len:379 (+),score=59.87 GHVR01083999.1:444-1580(+)